MDLQKLEQEQARGERIKAFLEDDIVKGVLMGLELSYFRAWKEAVDPAARDRLHAQASVLDDLRASLGEVVASGDRATLELLEQSSTAGPLA